MRYIEVLDRRLGFTRDLVDVVLGHAFVALVMLSAIVPFSIEYVDMSCTWSFFAIMVDDAGTIDSTYHINVDLYSNSSSI